MTRSRAWVVAGLVAASLGAVALPAQGTEAARTPSNAAGPLANVWVTAPDRSQTLSHPVAATGPPTVTLTADGTQRFQTWLGAGGALTDAATRLLTPMGAPLRAQLFDPTAERGARLNLVRLPLSATDFSTRGWTWQDAPGTPAQPPAEALASMRYVLRTTELRDDVGVVTAAWSAPTWMKSSASLNGGALRSDHVDDYAQLLLTETRRLTAAGVPVVATTLGNEPFNSNSTYPTMTMSDEQMGRLADLTAKPLAQRGVDLWALDHNWEHRGHLSAELAAPSGRRFAGAAFHCYGAGDSASATSLQRPWALTECTGGEWDTNWASTFAWQATHLVTDPVRRGSTALLMFNLALDPTDGPHTGGCGNCRGVVTVDPATRQWTPNPEFYLLAHLTRAADPGGRRIGLTWVGDAPAVAFANPDGTVGYFGINTGATRVIRLVAGSQTVSFSVKTGSLWSARLPGSSLAPETELAGRLVQWEGDGANPRTTWWVTPDHRRLWVPDSATFACLGGNGANAPRMLGADALDQLYDQNGLWAPCGDTMTTSRALRRGMTIETADDVTSFGIDGDGQLALRAGDVVAWSLAVGADYLTLADDGDLAAYSDLGIRLWHSNTAGSGADRLTVTATGRVRLMAGSRVVWQRS